MKVAPVSGTRSTKIRHVASFNFDPILSYTLLAYDIINYIKIYFSVQTVNSLKILVICKVNPDAFNILMAEKSLSHPENKTCFPGVHGQGWLFLHALSRSTTNARMLDSLIAVGVVISGNGWDFLFAQGRDQVPRLAR